MSGSLVQALIAYFDSVFFGPNGDYAAVLEATANLSASQALWKPAPSQNSIWQIVEHLIASKAWQIDMLEHGQANSPVWIDPSGDDMAWLATLERLKEAHLRLKQVLNALDDGDLLRTPKSENNTLLELVLSSGSAHEAHRGRNSRRRENSSPHRLRLRWMAMKRRKDFVSGLMEIIQTP
jgi:hypothetical protein